MIKNKPAAPKTSMIEIFNSPISPAKAASTTIAAAVSTNLPRTLCEQALEELPADGNREERNGDGKIVRLADDVGVPSRRRHDACRVRHHTDKTGRHDEPEERSNRPRGFGRAGKQLATFRVRVRRLKGSRLRGRSEAAPDGERERGQAEHAEGNKDDGVAAVIKIDDADVEQVGDSGEKPMASEVVGDKRETVESCAHDSVAAEHVGNCRVEQRVDVCLAEAERFHKEWIQVTVPPTCSCRVEREKSREQNQRHKNAERLTSHNGEECAEKAKDSHERKESGGRMTNNARFHPSACRAVPQNAPGRHQAQSGQRQVGVTVPPGSRIARAWEPEQRPDQDGKVNQEPAEADVFRPFER